MAPEAIAPMSQAECDNHNDGKQKMRLGRASDVWSLGCILYQIIFGRPPFASLNTIQKLTSIPNPKYIIHFPISEDSHAVESIQACLVHDPRKRPMIAGPDGLLFKRYLQLNSNISNAVVLPSSERHEVPEENISIASNPSTTSPMNEVFRLKVIELILLLKWLI